MMPVSDLQVSEELNESLQRSEIDASARMPVLCFYASALFWLLIGTFLSLLATIQLHTPGFLGGCAMLAFGRIWPASLNMLGYGWSSLAAVGTALWLMARLSRTRLIQPGFLILVIFLWNAGVLAGTLGILIGDSTSIPWLEFPAYATPILFTAFALMGIWAVTMFWFRRRGHIYISQWYLIAAFFWFPWAYTVATILVVGLPAQGVIQALVASWYGNSFLGLWLTSIALASAYYFVSKGTGKTIPHYRLAFTGFWLFALFTSWSGVNAWIGGPVPAWLLTVSILAGVLMILPLMIIGANLLTIFKGNFNSLKENLALRFIFFGIVSFLLAGFFSSLASFRSLNKIKHLTYAALAHEEFLLYGFLMMVFVGAVYYVLPRLIGKEWPSVRLTRAHFWIAALAVILMAGALKVAGLIQVLSFSDEKISFTQISQWLKPYLTAWSASLALMLLGQIVFSVSFAGILLRGSSKK